VSNVFSGSRRAVLALCVTLAWAVACVACDGKRPDGGVGVLPAGTVAPDFAAHDAAGKLVRFSEFAGKERVVYFYPKDETPGCTKEACAFRDAFDKYKERGVVLFGVSRDSEESHKKFREHHSLPFALAADESGDVQKAYGVPSKMGVLASRVTFLVGKDGKVERVWENVDPGVHAAEVLAAVQ
jgi:peroxiredoxin Q/BCP